MSEMELCLWVASPARETAAAVSIFAFCGANGVSPSSNSRNKNNSYTDQTKIFLAKVDALCFEGRFRVGRPGLHFSSHDAVCGSDGEAVSCFFGLYAGHGERFAALTGRIHP
mgnify:CR=1 FL=1